MSLRAGAALGAVILLIVALSALLRRLRESGGSSGPSRRLASLERLDLGAKREIRLVRADDRLLVVGITADRMELLSESPIASTTETTAPESLEASPFRMPHLRKVANPS
jgi:flagellar biosynthetic protein FliO